MILRPMCTDRQLNAGLFLLLFVIGHMALVSQNPGAHGGALGVITLEDVIEELIGEVNICHAG